MPHQSQELFIQVFPGKVNAVVGSTSVSLHCIELGWQWNMLMHGSWVERYILCPGDVEQESSMNGHTGAWVQPLSQEASEHQTEVTQHRHPHLWPTGSPVLRCPMFMDSGYDRRLDRRELATLLWPRGYWGKLAGGGMLLGTNFDKNTSCQGRGMGNRNINQSLKIWKS